jgi:putative endonuclease
MNTKKTYQVYILATERNGTLYVGVTNDLARRMYEHRTKLAKGFTYRYNISMLVYYEVHEEITSAIRREKQLKRWTRVWKLQLIEKFNPMWNDLYDDGAILPLPMSKHIDG